MRTPFASHGSRFGAFILDLGFAYIASFMGGMFGAQVATAFAQPHAHVAGSGFLLGWYFWGFGMGFVNMVILQGITGSSLGKMLFGLKVVNRRGEPMGVALAFGRRVAYYLSVIPLFLGFTTIFFNEKRRAIHDMICETVVIRSGTHYPWQQAQPILLPQPSDVAQKAA